MQNRVLPLPPPYQHNSYTTTAIPAVTPSPFRPNRVFYIGTWPGIRPIISIHDITDQVLSLHPCVAAISKREDDDLRPHTRDNRPESRGQPRSGDSLPFTHDQSWKPYDKAIRRILKSSPNLEKDLLNNQHDPAPPYPGHRRATDTCRTSNRRPHGNECEDSTDDDDLFDMVVESRPPQGAQGVNSSSKGLPPPLYIIDCSQAWSGRKLTVIGGSEIRYPAGSHGAPLASWAFPSDRPARAVFSFPPGSPQNPGDSVRTVTMSQASMCQQIGCPRQASRKRIPLLSTMSELLAEITSESYIYDSNLFQWSRDRNGSDQFFSLWRHMLIDQLPVQSQAQEEDRPGRHSRVNTSKSRSTSASSSGSASTTGGDDCMERLAHYRYLRQPFWSMFSDVPSGASLALTVSADGGSAGVDPLMCILGCINIACRALRMDLQRVLNL